MYHRIRDAAVGEKLNCNQEPSNAVDAYMSRGALHMPNTNNWLGKNVLRIIFSRSGFSHKYSKIL